MTMTVLTLTLATLVSGDDPAKDTPRKPSAIAPSLPALTKEEEDKLDEVIDRFIKADTGQLRGEDAKSAQRDFDKLGPEAIPALIRGLNKAALIEHSCPSLVIAKKLNRMLNASEDKELLEFAWDNIGAGVGRTRHSGMLNDLKVSVMLRKNALARTTPKGPKSPRAMTVTELVEAASTERGPRLKTILTELETRRGNEALGALSLAATSYDSETRDLGRELLEKNLSRQTAAVVKQKLQDEQSEIRRAAARVVGTKMPALGGDLIDLLADDKAEVREAAHDALVRLSKGEDFGPATDASKDERETAQRKWRSWWEKKTRR
jgi:hypothetical protein